MKLRTRSRIVLLWIALALNTAGMSVALGQTNDALVGIWTLDEGFDTVELLFRSDGRYQRDTRFPDPTTGFAMSERGVYEVTGRTLTMTADGESQGKRYKYEISGAALTLTTADLGLTEVYQYKPGSREDVLAREKVVADLVGTWGAQLTGGGTAEYTFRPGGYYILKDSFAPEIVRGRYTQDGRRLTLKPYGGTETAYDLDFFGNTLTLIPQGGFAGEAQTFDKVAGSAEQVRAKSAEAEAFLSRTNWQVGVWEVRDQLDAVDLTLRPDGYYRATNSIELSRGTVRGRYTLEPRRIHFVPFQGQDLYSRDTHVFGTLERTRELDYYEGELQLIDPKALGQAVTIARKRPDSEAPVLENTRQVAAERAREGWYVGVWEVNDPAGWMEFTLRPDGRYIAKSGRSGVPDEVERGEYLVRGDKVTLAPFPGLGAARGFELDLYEGELSLIGDERRLVVARKIAGSEAAVIEKSTNPDARKGERGSILGRWTADLPGESTELVFRPDGQFRLSRCETNVVSPDYGLYSVDLPTGTLVYDSRLSAVKTLGLDFYGDTLTLFGGTEPPRSFTVNLGTVDAAIAESLAADAAAAAVNQQWLARVPIGPRDPNAVQLPIGTIPPDPAPGRVMDRATVFINYQLYIQFRLGFVYFDSAGLIQEVPVVNTTEWHFLPNGRVLVRIKEHRAGLAFPITIESVTDSWGAYQIEPKPTQTDILHLYADNGVVVETDLGERIEMTLEEGRRSLFWGKDLHSLSTWVTEEKPVACQLPKQANTSLLNTGVSLFTSIAPDSLGGGGATRLQLTGPVSGSFAISGSADAPGSFITERATSLAAPIPWTPVQTNTLPAGPFSFKIPQGTDAAAYYRVRIQ